MIRLNTRQWWLGLIGLVWIATGNGHAWERPPVKLNTKIEFHFDVKVGPDFRRPTAPWYAYFPVDPRMSPSPQTSPYPPWPVPFPPPGPPPTAAKEAQHLNANMAVPRDPMTSQLWPSQSSPGTNLQPVGFVPAQVPSYWYQR